MARHARRDPLGTLRSKPLSAREQRAADRAHKAQHRRLNEREQISGEIRTPADVTAARARRGEAPRRARPVTADRTPVSARTLVPERTFSGRMIVLTLVTLVVISFLVPTVRTYMQQRAEMDELAASIATEEERQAELYDELGRWEDPHYVSQQARERLNLVSPGERRYHVVGDAEPSESSAEEVEEATEDEDWTQTLWESVEASAAE